MWKSSSKYVFVYLINVGDLSHTHTHTYTKVLGEGGLLTDIIESHLQPS